MNINIRAWDTDTNQFVDCSNHTISQLNNDYAGLGNRYVYTLWTGLKDMNGKKIFAGDILADNKDPKNPVGVVYFYPPQFVVQTRNENPYALAEGKVNMEQLNYTAVIGNIFENPDPDDLVERGIITQTEAVAMKIG
jgi:hypothetical protein